MLLQCCTCTITDVVGVVVAHNLLMNDDPESRRPLGYGWSQVMEKKPINLTYPLLRPCG